LLDAQQNIRDDDVPVVRSAEALERTESEDVRLLLVGAGPVGTEATRAAVEDGVAGPVVGVVDTDERARRTAAVLLGGASYEAVDDVPPSFADVAVVAFSSRASAVEPVAARLVQLGCDVVTTCEEMADPPRQMRLRLDAVAERYQRSIVVTGANPGFVMDTLPLFVSSGCQGLRRIRVVRRVDTSTRRRPLVAKSGYGMTTKQFMSGIRTGTVGHVGLEASARLLAEGLRWKVKRVETAIDPVMGDDDLAIGQHQHLDLVDDQGRSIALELTMVWGLANPGDVIDLEGTVGVRMEIPGGYPGDQGTTARVIRALSRLRELEPGFYRPIDMPTF
jgi:hypothetical protein